MIGMITFQFSNFGFGISNAAGLLFARTCSVSCALTITFGYIPQGALNMVKFGLMVFMAGVGLARWQRYQQRSGRSRRTNAHRGLCRRHGTGGDLLLVWRHVLRMNRALLFGAMMGARTCAGAIKSLAIRRAVIFQRWVMRGLTLSPTFC
ncbi:hypothetical protein KCP70_20655 [Salmonella enterica subsp. enterica]|nr:hypothetical protein KCP70_20655 [Salmonella enterica subsp. enterica]